MSELANEVDVLIVGAGLSGIGAAHHLVERCPDQTFAIWEGRDAIGGTWDLFRYPGIRSDSDMFTLGYRFKPWPGAKAIADGPSIRTYVNSAADDAGIREKITFNHWIKDASWDSVSKRWTVTAGKNGIDVQIKCKFLWMCSGYYRYKEGYTPEFPGLDAFQGKVIHPQQWPEDLDYSGKRVVVIGSGATAVTLIPSMADKTKHITMLQRSPTYLFSMPGTSELANVLRKALPEKTAYWLMRWQRIILQMLFFNLARAMPKRTKKNMIKQVREKLGPDYDVEKHFTPSYNPWDQRICLVPDDDLFKVISAGNASVETDHIETFTADRIKLKSGRELEADIVITATGLTLEALGGASIHVDGREVNFSDTLSYKGFMFSDVPNLAAVFGYTNASWTLRADLISDYVCRLLNHMKRAGYESATPVNKDLTMKREPYLDFTSGYVKRAEDILPKQGEHMPWRHPQNYYKDLFSLRYGKLQDGILQFDRMGNAMDFEKEVEALAAAE